MRLAKSKDEEGLLVEYLILDMHGISNTIAAIAIDGTYVSDYKIYAIDLNGDNKLELVTLDYGHNTSISVYQITGNKVKRVLKFYDGD